MHTHVSPSTFFSNIPKQWQSVGVCVCVCVKEKTAGTRDEDERLGKIWARNKRGEKRAAGQKIIKSRTRNINNRHDNPLNNYNPKQSEIAVEEWCDYEMSEEKEFNARRSHAQH